MNAPSSLAQPERRAPSLAARAAALGLPLLVAIANLTRYAQPTFVIDDSWISFRIAENLLRHGVLTYDLTRPPVEGMTNLLWTLLSVPAILWRPAIDPAVTMRLVGALLYLASVAVFSRSVLKATRHAGAALVAGLLLAYPGNIGFHALSGLETPLFLFLFVIALRLAIIRDGGAPQATLLGFVLAALALTRPEGVLLGGVFILITERLHGRPQALRAAVPFVAVLAATELFRLAYFHALVPNTYGAKPPSLRDGLDYGRIFLKYGLGYAGLAAAAAGARIDRHTRWAALLAIVYAAGVIATGGDWMFGYRRMIPVYAVVAFLGVRALAVRDRRRWVAAVGLAAMFAGNLVMTAQRREANLFTNAIWQTLGRRAQDTPGLERAALVDIGAFGWAFKRSIFDFAGLTDAHIAALEGTHIDKTWDEAYFRAQRPDVVFCLAAPDAGGHPTVFRKPERDVLRSIRENGGYSIHSIVREQGGAIVVLARDGFELPPSSWGEPLRLPVAQLPAKLLELPASTQRWADLSTPAADQSGVRSR